MSAMLRGLWLYRHFVLSSIKNDLVTRFTTSKLGAMWTILNPLSMVLIYSLVLSNILAARLPGIDNKYSYAIYLMSGFLAWNLFSDIINRCLTLFLEQANLLKKVNFPRITLPVIVIGSSLVNNLILFVAILFISSVLGHNFTWVVLWILPLTLLLAVVAVGLGLILGIMNVFVRDLGQLVPIMLQVLFWFTPIVYPQVILPENYRHLLSFNPMHHVVNAYQQVILYGQPPQFGSGLWMILVSALAVFIVSLFLFRRAGSEMVDML